MFKPTLPLLTLAAVLAACGQQGLGSRRVPTFYQMILQDGTVDPGALTITDVGVAVILRPQPGIAQRVASGSLTLQGKTFNGVANMAAFTGVQTGDVGRISLQLCRKSQDVQDGQNIGVLLNFYDAGGALLEQSHATIRKIVNPHYFC